MNSIEIKVNDKVYNILEEVEPPKDNKGRIKEHNKERLKQWTYDYYLESKNTIMNRDILPIVVPSYKRGYKA